MLNTNIGKGQRLGRSHAIATIEHDVRRPLPFKDDTFEACFSHMLYCMAFITAELKHLTKEVCRVLKPGGLNIYTVRNFNDDCYGVGIHRGDDMYEIEGGFVVHFFSLEMVQRLAKGYKLIALKEFEEGSLPRKLYLVTLRKECVSGTKVR
jgi:SAM-dependent methyltransferase